MMSLPKSWAVGWFGVGLELADEHVGVEDVDAHRRQREIRRAGNRRWTSSGFSCEARDPLLLVDGDDAEAAARRRCGTSMAASVTAAPRSWWKRSMRE